MSLNNDLQNKILRALKQQSNDSFSTQELMDRFEVARRNRRLFRQLLKDMECAGQILQSGKGRWTIAVEDELIAGIVECHRDGFGFLRPEGEGTDVFIPPGELRGAMHGDKVRARITISRRDGRRSGRVIEVLERARKYVIGTYKDGHVYPTNDRILERIFVPYNSRRQIADGELAELRITQYPDATTEPVGEIIARLGSIEEPSVDLKIIVSDHNLPREFPPDVLEEACAIPVEITPEERAGRRDLRSLPFVTVDPEEARDFDDAVFVKREGGGWRLWVAIADVSNYVRPGTSLDKEAAVRGTSIYFPEGVIPMLPEDISAGIASLKPDEDRLAMVAEITFGHNGAPREEEFYPAVIRSSMRLSYNQVSRAMLQKDKDERERIRPRIADLEVMLELAGALHKRRRDRGGLDFDLPEAMVMLGTGGEVEGIFKSAHDRSHNMIEEFMLCANEAVARFMAEKRLPALYRVHEDPDQAKLMELGGMLGAFGLGADFKEMGSRDISRRLQRVLEKVEGKPYEALINTAVLRSMKRARYDSNNLGHFGLAADNYLHFTSPIRRYPDLFVHRMLKMYVGGKPTRKPKDLEDLALRCSNLERRAEDAERDMDKLKAARFMKAHIGEEFDGFISGVTSFAIFVEITDYFIEGFIHESRLPADVYKHDEKSHQLKGRRTGRAFRLGDPLRVIVSSASIEKRQVDFDLVEPKPARKR